MIELQDELPESQEEEYNGDMFHELEKEYNIVSGEMENNPNCNSDHLLMYQTFFDYVFHTREQTLEISSIIQKLQDNIDTTSTKLEEATKTIINNSAIIDGLSERITDYHMAIDEAHFREQVAYEIIDNMQKTTSQLEQELNRHRILDEPDPENTDVINAMMTGKTTEQQEHDKLLNRVAKLRKSLKQTIYNQEVLELKTDDNDQQVEAISNELTRVQHLHEKEKHIKFIKTGTLLNLQEVIDILNIEESDLNAYVNEGKKTVLDLDKKLKQRYVDTDLCDKTLEAWNKKYCKLQVLANQSIRELKLLEWENNKIMWDNGFEESVMQQYHDIIDIIKNNKNASVQKGALIEEEMEKIQESTKELAVKLKNIKMSDEKQKMFEYKKEMIVLFRYRNNTISNIVKQKKLVTANLETISRREQINSKLSYDIIMHAAHERQQRKQITYLEKERDRLREEAVDKVESFEDTLIKSKQLQHKILGNMTLIREQKKKSRMLQKQYEMAITNKLALEKDLMDNKANNACLNGKYLNACRVVDNTVSILKTKNAEIAEMKASVKALVEKVEQMSKELSESYEKVKNLKTNLAEKKSLIEEIRAAVNEMKEVVKRQNEAINALISERDHLGQQLQKRNMEIALLYHEMEIFERVSKHSSVEYDKRVKDIEVLKLEIRRQRHWKQIFTERIVGAVNLKEEINHLQTSLVKEKVKCKMMECDIEKPVIIHRWRQLEFAKPDEYGLLMQLNFLQKRCVKVEQRLEDKKLQLKEILQLYKNLRKMLKRQRGPVSSGYVKKKKQQLGEMKEIGKYTNLQRKQYQLDNVNIITELEKTKQELFNARQELRKLKRIRYQWRD